MCLGVGLLGELTGANKAAKQMKKQAKAEEEQSRLQAQAAQQQLESNIAQNKASAAAKELLSKPVESTSVEVGDTSASGEVDPVTGRRRSTRSRFQLTASGSGLAIP